MVPIKYDSTIFDQKLGRLTLLEAVSGQSAFLLIREENLDVNFYHCSPSTGTRVSTVNIGVFQPSSDFRFDFLWAPDVFQLAIFAGGKYVKSNGFKTPDFQLRVGMDGDIYQVGDKGVTISNLIITNNGKTVLQSSAIESWGETIEAIKILQTGTSPQGYVYESLLSNQLISLLCSSFEVYGKRRFIELINEGITPNYASLEKIFFTKWEREKGLMGNYEERAKQRGCSLAQEIVEKRKIDFGNYQDCKDAFSKGYGLDFSENLGVGSTTINTITEFIEYRHHIIHASPMLPVLNIKDVPPEEPVFPTNDLVNSGLKSFDAFIKGLHKATQSLGYAKPKNEVSLSSPDIHQQKDLSPDTQHSKESP